MVNYKADNDSISEFINTCCVLGPDFKAGSKQLMDAYSAFCRDNGFTALKLQDFKAAMERHKLKSKRSNAGVFYHGIRVKANQEPVLPF